MKHAKRILCSVLAAALLLTAMLTGCSIPKITLGGTADVAATIGEQSISTGEYLAYLYNEFYNLYYSQGLYQYEMYGYDVWTQEYTYGEGDDAEKLDLSAYITRLAQDNIKRQAALDKLLKDNNLSWIEEEAKQIEEDLAETSADAYLSLGINDEHFATVYKAIGLNERSLFFGLYGKGGTKEVTETELKKYFTDNYLSYKIISIALTDDEGKELDEAGKKKITDQLNGYLEQYNKDKNFEAVVDAYNKANAAEDEEIEASKDEDNRVDTDANDLDEELAKAIRTVDVGTAKVVTYQASGTTATAALVLRLDINDPADLYTDSYEAILSAIKYETFNEDVEKAMEEIKVVYNESVVKKCKPENFVTE